MIKSYHARAEIAPDCCHGFSIIRMISVMSGGEPVHALVKNVMIIATRGESGNLVNSSDGTAK
jgi:hypothetical protein